METCTGNLGKRNEGTLNCSGIYEKQTAKNIGKDVKLFHEVNDQRIESYDSH